MIYAKLKSGELSKDGDGLFDVAELLLRKIIFRSNTKKIAPTPACGYVSNLGLAVFCCSQRGLYAKTFMLENTTQHQ